jgi:hypothetical protein
VQAFPSSQTAALFVWTQPLAGAHESFVHTLLSLQLNVPTPGWQLPPLHVSPTVQAFPSSHAAVLFAWTHPTAASHESVVQALLSSQSGAPAPGWQLPPAHASPTVQALPSSHVAALLT